MRRTLLACALLAVCAPALLPATASAQDDWEVKRDPFDKRIVARYKGILRKNPGDRDALNKLSQLYKRYRSINLLIAEYEKALEAAPTDFSTLVILGNLMTAENQPDRALAYFEKGAAEKPDDPTVQIALGDLYRGRNEPDKARTAYDKALEKATGKATKKQILRQLAELAFDKAEIDAAKRYYEQYIALDPGDLNARLDLADALVRHEKYPEAIEVYQAAEAKLKSDPAMRVDVIARMGAAHEKAGADDAAVREYKRAMGMTQKGYYLRKELTYRIIDIYRRRQELSKLIEEYEKEWKPDSRGHMEWDTLARLYEETGLQDKAIEAYRKAVKKTPTELETQRRLITLLVNSGRGDEALAQYEAVIKIAPGEPRFQLELAEKYMAERKEAKALAMLKQIEAHFPTDVGVHAALADLYTKWGKDDLALAAYIRLTTIEPNEVMHLINLGEQYWSREDKPKAIAIWKKIGKTNNPASLAKLGEVYGEHEMHAEALASYTKAIKAKPKEPDFYRGRAAIHEQQKNYDGAIKDWETALSLIPDKKINQAERREARRRVVGLLRSAGGSRLEERIRDWEKDFKKTPPDMSAADYLVEAYLRNAQYRQAKATLERVLEIIPDDVDSMDQLVKVYRSEHEYDKAIALLLKLAEISPARQRDVYNQIAEIKTILHQDTEAIDYALRALEKTPNDPVAHQRLAERYEDMLQYEKAIEAYEKTLQLDPRAHKASFALARLYLRHDKSLKAAELYRGVLRTSTEEETLLKAGRYAIDLEELTSTLGELERVVSPLAALNPHKPVYRRIVVELYERYVPALVARARRGTTEQRQDAVKELERLGSRGLKPLLEALSDEQDLMQQRIAVGILGYLGNKGAAPPLVKLAKQTQKVEEGKSKIGTFKPLLDWDVRVDALVAAGRLGDPRTIPDLVELTRHREGAMREAATFALGMTGDKRAIAPLLDALDDALPSVRTLGCLGLARVADKKTFPRVIDVVRSAEHDDTTRAACAFALGALVEKSAVPALSETLGEGNDEVQRIAAWALGRIASGKALPALLGSYFSKRDRIREAVAWALPRVVTGAPATEDVVTFMDYPMRLTKFDARAAVRNLASPLDAPPLTAAVIVGHEKELTAGLREALGRHRDLVVRVLIDLDDRDGAISLGPLTARIDEAAASERDAVGQALDRIGAAILPELEKLTEHRDTVVRQRALSVMAKIGTPEVGPLLQKALDDDRRTVREAAMIAASSYVRRQGNGAKPLVDAVAAKLSAERWQERKAAAEALGRFGALGDGDALARALSRDAKAFVRQAAASSLGLLGDRSKIPALIKAATLAEEPSAAVRLAAVRSLVGMGDPSAKEFLSGVAEADPDSRVREAAKRFH